MREPSDFTGFSAFAVPAVCCPTASDVHQPAFSTAVFRSLQRFINFHSRMTLRPRRQHPTARPCPPGTSEHQLGKYPSLQHPTARPYPPGTSEHQLGKHPSPQHQSANTRRLAPARPRGFAPTTDFQVDAVFSGLVVAAGSARFGIKARPSMPVSPLRKCS